MRFDWRFFLHKFRRRTPAGTVQQGVIAYCIRQGDASFLCVIDDAGAVFRYPADGKPGFYRFPINDAGLTRLAADAALGLVTSRNRDMAG